jgi:hypothetical protein
MQIKFEERPQQLLVEIELRCNNFKYFWYDGFYVWLPDRVNVCQA